MTSIGLEPPGVGPGSDRRVFNSLVAAREDQRVAHERAAVQVRRHVRRGLRSRRVVYRHAAFLLADGEVEGMVARKVLDLIEECYPGDDGLHVHVRRCLELDLDDALAALPFDDDPGLWVDPESRAASAAAFVSWSRVFLLPVPPDLRALLCIVEPELPARSPLDTLCAFVLGEPETWANPTFSLPCAFPRSMPLPPSCR
jgi:hypothetical protein